jgi:hypothetical protein
MEAIVLVAVVAVWAAVIVPPLMRSRSENRPNSSVHDFRRQLSTLQRTVPTRTMVPMRGMARPLTQAPQATRTHGHHGQVRRVHGVQGVPDERMHTATLDRGATGAHHRQTHLHRVSQRELLRRRRANVLFSLVLAVGITGFLAATTNASAMVYAFAISFIATCGYCYKLAQLRAYELNRQHADHNRSYFV